MLYIREHTVGDGSGEKVLQSFDDEIQIRRPSEMPLMSERVVTRQLNNEEGSISKLWFLAESAFVWIVFEKRNYIFEKQ